MIEYIQITSVNSENENKSNEFDSILEAILYLALLDEKED